MNKHKPMVETRVVQIQCHECKKMVERKVREGFAYHGPILNSDYIMNVTWLTNVEPEEEFGAYHKRIAEFCSPECMIKYCYTLTLEDLGIEG